MPRRAAPNFDYDNPWLSKSGVLTYERCPNRFWRQVIKKMPVSVEQPQLVAGIAAHETLYELYDKIDQDAILAGETTVSREYSKHLPEDEWATNYLVMEQKRWEVLADGKRDIFFPLLREQFLASQQHRYYGTADRFDRTEYGDYAVLDYKLSVFKKYMLGDYRFELAGYATMANEVSLFPRPVAWGGIVFLRGGTAILFRIKQVTFNAWKRRTTKVRKGIQKREFPKKSMDKTTWLCDYCPYQKDCFMEEGFVS